ncbi:hypothetical protein C8R46DRAFT_1005409 [Mycena filopes]|nr:hypothetical protein C8R46DRAFT_1005409 [Mycena filopes]
MSDPLELDPATAALIRQLTLDDIDDLRASSKGKGREDDPPTDAECALKAHADETDDLLRFLQDLEFARSMDNALEFDQPVLSVLSVLEDGVRDDHVYAEALQNDQALPEQSEVQRLLEDPDFHKLIQSNDVEDETSITTDDPESDSPASSVTDDHPSEPRPTHACCIICRDDVRPRTAFRAPCTHFYCRQCIANLATACIGDESLFPLQCCRQNLPLEGLQGVLVQLELRLRIAFRRKADEFGTLFNERLYCVRPTCSRFLGSTADHTADADSVVCGMCRTAVCARCKQLAHPGVQCGTDEALEAVRALAEEKHWQTCPGCAQIIDLQQGCYHMTCRCRTEFCYLCAARWKNCTCPQWEEARLLDTAEQRVENEIGAQARAAAPRFFQRLVEDRVERLRYAHDCANGHRWSRRNGRAQCNECRHMLPDFLLFCRTCGIGACVRCARNRL